MTDPQKKVTAEDIVNMFEGAYFLLSNYQRDFWIRRINEALTLAAQEARECEADKNEAEYCHECCYNAQEKARKEGYTSGAEAMRERCVNTAKIQRLPGLAEVLRALPLTEAGL